MTSFLNPFTEEHEMLRDSFRQFMETEMIPHAREWERNKVCPRHIFERMGELGFFGVAPSLVGSGAGRWLMNHAIAGAWSRPITRFWVHTCTLDHQDAVDFYVRSGFRAFRRQIEIASDPRLAGLLPFSFAYGLNQLLVAVASK